MTRWARTLLGMSLIFSVACGDDSEAEEPIIIISNNNGSNNGENNPANNLNNPDPVNNPVNNPDPNNPVNNPDPTNNLPMNQVADMIGDGDPTSVEFVKVHTNTTTMSLQATAIAFNPENTSELWITQRLPKSDAPCTSLSQTPEGCGSLEGVTTIVFNPGAAGATSQTLIDGNSWHFMRRPSSMAFGAPNTFATCHEERTGNMLDDVPNFIGPSLWSSDLAIFAQDPGRDSNGQPLNGSHLDMLHQTPYCMGIAHDKDNAYWTFNGMEGSLDHYDFKDDHGPGYHDHSDGEVRRYAVGQVSRVEGVPSHMVVVDDWVFIADTGNSRVAKFNPEGASATGAINPTYEPLAVNQVLTGGVIEDVATTLQRPSGIVHHNGVLFVSDNADGKIYAISPEGEILRELPTQFTNGDLSALAVGPDNKLYYASLTNAEVWRIDPK